MVARAVPRRRQNATAYRAITGLRGGAIIARGESPDVAGRSWASTTAWPRATTRARWCSSTPPTRWPGDVAAIQAFDEAASAAAATPVSAARSIKAPHHRTFVPTLRGEHALGVPGAGGARRRGWRATASASSGSTQRAALQVDSYRVARREETFSPDVAANVPAPGQAEVPLSQKPKPVRFETVLTVAPERSAREFPAGTLLRPHGAARRHARRVPARAALG